MPATNPVTQRYYPRLSEVMTVDDLPDFLQFAQDGLDALLDSIHYKNLQFSKSHNGDSAFYSLDIVTKNIGFDLPFGLRFVLNPDTSGDSSISSFPVTLQYTWPVLAFLRSFSVPSFSFTPDGVFQLGLQVFKVSDVQVIANTLNYFVNPADATISTYQQLINDINTLYPSAGITLPAGQTPTVSIVATLISQNPNIPKSISELMFAAYILNTDLNVTKTRLQQFYNLIVPGGIEDYLTKLIKPSFKASLTLSAGIEFPTSILQPVNATGTVIPNTKSIFQFAEATFYVDTQSGIGSQLELGGSLIPTYAQIGSSGLIISFTGAKLDLSQTTNIPEADAAGYAKDFMGLYIKQASVSFSGFGSDSTTHQSASITANNLFIGTGGVSGMITLADSGVLYRNFGSFAAELDSFSLTFHLGSITASTISGKITIPRFTTNNQPAVINIQAAIKDNGDFSITALPSADAITISLLDVLDIVVRKLSIGKEAKGFYVEVAGTLNFTANIPLLGEVLPKGIDIKKLRIWEDGSIEFSGGGLVLPKSFKINIGPVSLEVSKISLGSYTKTLNGVERNYNYFGFDGMVNAGNAGLEVNGNGIKYYFTNDDGPGKPFDQFLNIAQIIIDLVIPSGASKDDADFILHGFLSMKNPDPSIPGSNAGTEYTGSVSFTIPSIDLSGSAGMRLTPSIPSFIVDIDLELSTPIPLGPTALGIYGFRGLIGEHYVPSKSATTPPLPETATWWEYYKAKSIITGQEGVQIDKFASKSGFSIGAGLTVATEFDTGFTFSARVFLLLGLPDVLLIQGQAGILQKRIGLDDKSDPPFSALIAIDSTSFQGDLGVDYRLPSGGSFDGKIFSLTGHLELAFFFNNLSAWYLNIGRDQPETARVRAKILTLFQGYAYVMLSARGFKAGAGAQFNFNKSFGPVGIGFGVSVDLGAFVSFTPIQIGGFIQLGGYAYLKFFFFKLGLSVQIGLAAEAPHPFSLIGTLKLNVHTPWPLPNIKLNAEISWRFNTDNSQLLQPIPILPLPDAATGYIPAKATNILTNETFGVNYVTVEMSGDSITIPPPGNSNWAYNFTDATAVQNVTIPLDSFIDIEFAKPVQPGIANIGGASNQLPDGYAELLPPQKGISEQVKHTYEILSLDIFAWQDNGSGGGTWMPYQIYEAVTAIVNNNTSGNTIDLSALKQGYWQFTQPNRYNKIRLLAQNMFSYTASTTNDSTDLDGKNFPRKAVFCYDEIMKQTTINWIDQPLNTTYPENTRNPFKNTYFTLTNVTANVQTSPAFNQNGLYLTTTQGSLLLELPQAVTYFELNFGANQNDITVTFITLVYTPGNFGTTIITEHYGYPAIIHKEDQNAPIVYNNIDQPVDKVLLEFNKVYPLDFTGDVIIGGHFALPDAYLAPATPPAHHETELPKTLMYAALYNQSFTQAEVYNDPYGNQQGAVAQWPLENTLDVIGESNGIITGSPDKLTHFYAVDAQQEYQEQTSFAFASNADALFVPYDSQLKVEDNSFSVEVTVSFDPFTAGIGTLFHKVATDSVSGYQKGFALHLAQDTPGTPCTVYADAAPIPQFKIWFTCYDRLTSSGLSASCPYTLDCTTSFLTATQYKHVLVTIDRTAGQVNIFVDRILKSTAAIPAELGIPDFQPTYTYFNQYSYMTQVLHQRQIDNPITKNAVINEIQLLSDNLNKTIQPVWRPDTTFAVAVKTRDVVTAGSNKPPAIHYTSIYGFRTAGPLGHFHQQSPAYQALAAKDQQDQFKLASLKSYINYDRSSPDAQGRYNLSKPVLYHDPQINLFFTQPYINAMYADWASYQGLPALQSSLQIQLLDPYGAVLSPQLIWQQLPDVAIDLSNYKTLPTDLQLLFLLNLAASADSCNENPLSVTRKVKQGVYEFPDLLPGRLYTALFNATYQPAGQTAQSYEVHRFSFISSIYPDFTTQASSFILDATPGSLQYAVYTIPVGFTASQISQNLLPIVNNSAGQDPNAVLNYAVKFDRLVYGGLLLKNPGTGTATVISAIVNTDPGNGTKTLLGIMIKNPEPFNDPKITADSLANSIQMSMTLPDASVQGPGQFLYFHSGDTSGVFITNAAMNVPAAEMELNFLYKVFNGTDYESLIQTYTSPVINMAPYLL